MTARKAAGFTSQTTLAEAVGTGQRQVTRWENNQNVPTEYREKLTEVLNLPADFFPDDGTATLKATMEEVLREMQFPRLTQLSNAVADIAEGVEDLRDQVAALTKRLAG